MPIGERPNGSSWTGFQSISEGSDAGYMLLFREANDRQTATIKTALPKGRYVCFVPILGSGASFASQTGAEGDIEAELPNSHSYALYSYKVHAAKRDCTG